MRPRSALAVLEASVHLLRSMPPSLLASYLAGAIPFHTGLLFFLMDMANSAFAPERLTWESLIIAALFVWKSTWQSRFAAGLYQHLSEIEPERTPWLRLVLTQTMLQPVGLLLLPLALLITLPFPTCFAFFRAAGLFVALREPRPVAAAWRHATLWPKQSAVLLSVVSLAGVLLFANVLIAIALLPQLGRSLLGIEGDLARLGIGILNVSTVSVSISITWIIVDALLEAAFVIRCFHGESRGSGRDLRVAFRRVTAAALVVVALCVGGSPLWAQVEKPAERRAVDVQRLDDSIHQVVQRPEFAWRTVRPPGPEPQGRWVGWLRSAWDSVLQFADWVGERLRKWFESNQDTSRPQGAVENPPSLQLWLLLIALALVGGGVVLFLSSRRTVAITPGPTPAAPAAVNIADDAVTADQLPESSWLALAEELLDRGECRLALRALYLAGLNHLSEVQLISIRRWKTGRDYRIELERRARARNNASAPAITRSFAESVIRFEQGWYGRYPVERGNVEELAASLTEVRRYARGT